MLEYHGWLTILEADTLEDESQALEQRVRDSIDPAVLTGGWIRIGWSNGQLMLSAAGAANHAEPDLPDVVGMFSRIAAMAEQPYGLLYVWDDEDEGGLENEFQVYVAARGSLRKQRDRYLSPCQPTIED